VCPHFGSDLLKQLAGNCRKQFPRTVAVGVDSSKRQVGLLISKVGRMSRTNGLRDPFTLGLLRSGDRLGGSLLCPSALLPLYLG
jgi:hypothetical protein